MRIQNLPRRSSHGFTLVELVVVIVILGILAATAIPRFVNLGTQARVAAVNGVAGGMSGAVALAQSAYFAAGNNTNTTANMNGTTVTVNPGIVGGAATTLAAGAPTPNAAGIGAALGCPNTAPGGGAAYTCGGLTFTFPTSGTLVTVQQTGSTLTTCQATYDSSTGLTNAIITTC